MSSITVWFIRCAMIYFVLAIALGLHMVAAGPQPPYFQLHVHFNLLGWMSMMIFGVGYHILPRFSGVPLWSNALSSWHLWLANIGLIGMALGWVIRNTNGGYSTLLVFSAIEVSSILFFVVNIFKTIRPAPAPAPAVKK